jgi:hypothetical protein
VYCLYGGSKVKKLKLRIFQVGDSHVNGKWRVLGVGNEALIRLPVLSTATLPKAGSVRAGANNCGHAVTMAMHDWEAYSI